MEQTVRERLIAIAAKKEKSAVVYQNISVIEVMTRETYTAEVAIDSGFIAAVGEGYEGVENRQGTNILERGDVQSNQGVGRRRES
jgi:adenine deaminase